MLQTILQVASFLVLALTNVGIWMVAYEQLDDEVMYDTYRLKFATAFHGLQILAALVLWHYSTSDSRHLCLVWLVLAPMCGIIYCLARLGKAERYRYHVMLNDRICAVISVGAAAALIWA